MVTRRKIKDFWLLASPFLGVGSVTVGMIAYQMDGIRTGVWGFIIGLLLGLFLTGFIFVMEMDDRCCIGILADLRTECEAEEKSAAKPPTQGDWRA